MTFWQRADIFKPCLVRLLARNSLRRPMHWTEICNNSDSVIMTPVLVESVSQMTSWEHVPFGTTRAFTTACRLDLCDWTDVHRAKEYIKFAGRPKTMAFEYLRRSPDWDKYYRPLLITWLRSYPNELDSSDLWSPLKTLVMRLQPLAR